MEIAPGFNYSPSCNAMRQIESEVARLRVDASECTLLAVVHNGHNIHSHNIHWIPALHRHRGAKPHWVGGEVLAAEGIEDNPWWSILGTLHRTGAFPVFSVSRMPISSCTACTKPGT